MKYSIRITLGIVAVLLAIFAFEGYMTGTDIADCEARGNSKSDCYSALR